MIDQHTSDARKPRIVLMGEFSAGKSTLCNMLMDAETLPEKVTATRLAPVWMTKGPGQHMRICTDGTEEPIALETLASTPVSGTAYIRLCLEEEILDQCDFVDCPGISDPNMDSEVWERVLAEADSVLWLTHSTQAWRQSEAAVWEDVAPEVKAKSLLLLTRWDKLTTETDRARVYNRVTKETAGQFQSILPISITDALMAGDDFEAWQASGAAALIETLSTLIATLNAPGGRRSAAAQTPLRAPAPVAELQPVAAQPAAAPSAPLRAPVAASPAPATSGEVVRIVPRRVSVSGTRRAERPRRQVRV